MSILLKTYYIFSLLIISAFLFSPKVFASSVFYDNFNDSEGIILSQHNTHWSFVDFEPGSNRWAEFQIHSNKAGDGIGSAYDVDKLDITLPSHFLITENFSYNPIVSSDPSNAFLDIRLMTATDGQYLFRFYVNQPQGAKTLDVLSLYSGSTNLGTYNYNQTDSSESNKIEVEYNKGIFIARINEVSVLTFSDLTQTPDHIVIDQSKTIPTALLNSFQVEDLDIPDPMATPTPTPTPTPSPTPSPSPIDCELSNWGTCSAVCGGGTQTRTIIQLPENGGLACGPLSQSCNAQPCPTPIPTPFPISRFSQRDPIWKNQIYDSANTWAPATPTIEHWGCALTASSTILDYYGFHYLPNGETNNPGTLNAWLKTQPDGYIAEGFLNWNAVSRASKLVANSHPELASLEYKKVGSDFNELRNRLARSQPVILEVPGHFVTAYHYDLATSSTSIIDPFWGSTRPTLASYANTFISARTYTPSHTNLGYIIVASDPEVSTQVEGESSYLQEEIIDQNNSPRPNSAHPIQILEFPKPDNGIYQITSHRTAPGLGNIQIFAYDQDGNPLVTTQSNIFGSGVVSFKLTYNKVGNSLVVKNADFIMLINDIKTLQIAHLFRFGYNGESLLHLAMNAQKLYPKSKSASKVMLLVLQNILRNIQFMIEPKAYASLSQDLKLVIQQTDWK